MLTIILVKQHTYEVIEYVCKVHLSLVEIACAKHNNFILLLIFIAHFYISTLRKMIYLSLCIIKNIRIKED